MRIKLFFTTAILLLVFNSKGHSQNTSKGRKLHEAITEMKSNNVKFDRFSIFETETEAATNNYSNVVSDGIVLNLIQDELDKLLSKNPQNLELEIPFGLEGETVILELFEKDIFSSDIVIRTSDGRTLTENTDLGKHYRGIMSGQATSLVSISIFSGEITGFISNDSGTYTIGKLVNSSNQHILYESQDLLQQPFMNCETADDENSYSTENLNYNQSASSGAGKCVNVYVESGNSVYDGLGGDLGATTTFLSGLFAQSYVLYANEGIIMQTSELFIWTTADPYTSSDSGTQLSTFQSNTSSLNADIGHLVDFQGAGTGVAAGFDGICNPDLNESLCFSGLNGFSVNDVPTYSFNVFLIAHEMGHLLGSRHTHACVWNGNNTAIDGCSGFTEGSCALPGSPAGGGTIMSYCPNDPVGVNFNEGFHPQPSAVINNVVNNSNNCLFSCGDCTITSVPTNLLATAINVDSALINWDAQINVLYDLRYRESGTTPWIVISDLVSSYNTLTGLAELTEYEVQVRSKCPGDTPTAYSSSVFFTTLEFVLAYCDAGSTQVAPSPTFTNIDQVIFNTLNNGPTGHSGYTDFTNLYTLVSRDNSYTITVSESSVPYVDDRLLVWIDFNKDGDFIDPGENVINTTGSSFGGNFGSFGGTFAIPTNAALGTTRMRIRMTNPGGVANITPCGFSTFGEVEDYTIVIYDDYVHYDNTWTPQNPEGVSFILDNILIVDGSPTFSSITETGILTIQRNATLNIEDVLFVNENLENDGNLIFKSDANGTGQLDVFIGMNLGTGEVTVERYIPAKRAFRLLASPVTTTEFIYENWQQNGLNPGDSGYLSNSGIQITGGLLADGFDQSGSNNPSMFTFDNFNSNGGTQTDDWNALANTNNTKLEAGVPYLTMVRGDRSIDLTNNDSPATPTILRAKGDLFTGSSFLELSTTSEHYSLIANPYQAVVDFDDVTKTGLTGYIYVWDAVIDGANGRGGYVTVDLPSSGVVPPPASSSQASQFLAPGMSFFVQNDTDVNISSTIFFQEPNKRPDVAEVDIFSTYSDFYINSRLYETSAYLNGDTESDAIGLRFSNDFTTPGDSEDATKLFNPGENYAIANNGLRSIDKQQIPTIGHQIDLTILNYQETNYSLTFMMENKPAGLDVFIIDNYLNTQTELAASFVYDFSVDANIPQSVAEDRFSLVFDTTTLSVDENTFGEGFRLYPNPVNNGQFSIRTPNLSGEVTVELVNMLGQKVMSKNLTIEGNEVNVNAGQLSDGVYIVKLVKDKKTFVTKLIVE